MSNEVSLCVVRLTHSTCASESTIPVSRTSLSASLIACRLLWGRREGGSARCGDSFRTFPFRHLGVFSLARTPRPAPSAHGFPCTELALVLKGLARFREDGSDEKTIDL